MLTPWKKSYDQPRQHIKTQRHYCASRGPSSQGYGFSSGHAWMWELDLNPKGNQFWIFTGRTDAEAPTHWLPEAKRTHWKRPWCWERLRAGGEGDDRGWDGWVVSWTQWTGIWASSRRRERTGKPGVLQAMASQTVRHNWATEQTTKKCLKPIQGKLESIPRRL